MIGRMGLELLNVMTMSCPAASPRPTEMDGPLQDIQKERIALQFTIPSVAAALTFGPPCVVLNQW